MPYTNKEDQNACSRRWYQRNKVQHIRTARKIRARTKIQTRAWLDEYLKHHPCVDCGHTDLRVLEFDHVRGQKLGNVGDMLNKGWSLKTVKAEVAKCDVRCANCHRVKTFEARRLKMLTKKVRPR